jgi:hypothetical protein
MEKTKLDKDFNNYDWNYYLQNRYNTTYRFERSDDGIKAIRCKKGKIEPYSIIKAKVIFISNGYNRIIYFINKVKRCGVETTNWVICDDSFSCVFNESDLKLMENVLQIRKRKLLTEEHKNRLRERMKERKWLN